MIAATDARNAAIAHRRGRKESTASSCHPGEGRDLCPRWHRPAPAWRDEANSRHSRISRKEARMKSFSASDGVQLAYYVDDFTDPWKDAPILLLLHAAMGSALRYYAWVPSLSRHYRVVRMDLRGHGNSPVPPADRELTLERLVCDVAELMDHLGCASARIVGNSAGGCLGQQHDG